GARRDAVGAHVAVAEFARDAARKSDQPMLSDRTVNAMLRARQRLHAAQRDDRAAAILEHRRDARLRAIESTVERNAERKAPFLVGQFEESLFAAYGCIEHEN